MPSPLPGLDPYLESPVYWRGFHNMLITFITQALNEALPTGFAANAEERVYILPQERSAVPDVVISRPGREAASVPAGVGTAVMEAAPPDGEVFVQPEDQREGYIEIRTAADWERIIAVIEVLSPANKSTGVGRDEYLTKQNAMLQSGTSLLEIDLLSGGLQTVAALVEVPAGHGIASLHRSWKRYHYSYWLFSVREPIPTVSVPLTLELPEVPLPLQRCFDRAYDAGPYRRSIDYSEPPPVNLSNEDSDWLADRLKAALH